MEFMKIGVRLSSVQGSVLGSVLFSSGFCLTQVSVRLCSGYCSTVQEGSFRFAIHFCIWLGSNRVDDSSQLQLISEGYK